MLFIRAICDSQILKILKTSFAHIQKPARTGADRTAAAAAMLSAALSPEPHPAKRRKSKAADSPPPLLCKVCPGSQVWKGLAPKNTPPPQISDPRVRFWVADFRLPEGVTY